MGTSKMEVSEGFQVYCREGATHWRIQKLIDRREIETQWNQHWKITDGETVAGQASQDLWKMEFKDMESTLGDMEVNVGLRWIWERKIMETILKQLRPEIEEQTQGIVWGMN